MVHSLTYGVLSTWSSRSDPQKPPVPFGNVYSFVDGPCHNSTGNIYLYGTYMDQSLQDVQEHSQASFTLTAASLDPVCHKSLKACSINDYGDPESPVCARLTLTGRLVEVEDDVERDWAQSSLFQRHPSMAFWPHGHHWVVMRLDIDDLWFLDYFGGASILDPVEYFAYSPNAPPFQA